MKHIMLRANYISLKNNEVVCSVDKYQLLPLPKTYNNALNVIRNLRCYKLTVYRVFENAFSSFFVQDNGRCCSW